MSDAKNDKAERLAAALRDNLRRRKAQARETDAIREDQTFDRTQPDSE